MPNSKGSTVMITGGNQGIGLATAKALACDGYNVVIACRNEERAIEAVKAIKQAAEERKIESTVDYLVVDFSCLKSVQFLNEDIVANDRRFDVVVLNAGVLLPDCKKTKDGLETSFQVNYLAQYMLVKCIIKNQQGKQLLKVVTLTSVMYKLCGILFPLKKDGAKWYGMFNPKKDGNQWKAYAMSKFATAAMAGNLNRLEGVEAVAVHPGAVSTNLLTCFKFRRHLNKARNHSSFLSNILLTADDAAKHVTTCVERDIDGCRYYQHTTKPVKLNSTVRNPKYLDNLTQLSDNLIRQYA